MEQAGESSGGATDDEQMTRVVALVRRLRGPAHTISGLVELLAETPEQAAVFSATLASETASLLVTIEQLAELVDPTPHVRASAPRRSAGLDGSIVLVVDDSPVNQLLVTSQLVRLGFASAVAPSGVQALEMMLGRRFDAVLMDWHMPGMDGLETTALLRRREKTAGLARTPVIAVTARAMLGDRERCLAAGMDGFLSKPLGIDDLSRALSIWLPLSPRRVDRGPAEPLTVEAALVEPSALGRLAEELGNRTIVVTLVETYLTELPERVDELIGAVAAADREVACRVAHTLKSTSSMLGAPLLAELAAEVEQASADAAPDTLVKLVESLADLAQQTRVAMIEASAQFTLSR